MQTCTAVLLDTVSIQGYIFQSNSLKDNIGASHLVTEIFISHLAKALAEVTALPSAEITTIIENWKKSGSKGPCPAAEIPFECGYIGGGNALLFFCSPSLAKQFITSWTRRLLVHAPGMATAVALDDAFPSDPSESGGFQAALGKLFHRLNANKGWFTPQVQLPRHGITTECNRTGLSANGFNTGVDEFVSATASAFISSAKQSSEELEKKYLEERAKDYCFSNELEDLGGLPGKDSHIAVVHIDGNSVGELFRGRGARDLKTLRQLSCRINKGMENSFDRLISRLTGKEDKDEKLYGKIMQALGHGRDQDAVGTQEYRVSREVLEQLRRDNTLPEEDLSLLKKRMQDRRMGGKKKFLHELKKRTGLEFTGKIRTDFLERVEQRKILPIRPIILGGDDLTFVCDAKLGLYFSECIMKEFAKTEIEIKGKKLSSCAGVAVIKTKYPFYRGYKLAEELCKNAKKRRKEQKAAGSYLDFHIALGSVPDTLEQIRAADYRNHHFTGDEGSLLYRPFPLDPEKNCADASFAELRSALAGFLKPGWSEVRLNELNRVLVLPKDERSAFIRHLEYRKVSLPELPGGNDYIRHLFAGGRTPYFDLLEIKRFYPEFVLSSEDFQGKRR